MFGVQLLDYLPLFFTCLGFCLIGAVVQLGSGEAGDDDEAGTPRRRKSRPREERGLPDRKTLYDLAKTYLEVQCRLWPELVKSGQLRRVTKAEIDKLVADFEGRFRNQLPVATCNPIVRQLCEAVGAAYLRFSCDKSNPRSLVQQLKLVLEKSASNRHFIPWSFVFADAGISGTTDDRVMYQLLNRSLENEAHEVDALYIDEVGRASRDLVEALRLGTRIVDEGKLLIGVSDGFDSRSPMAKLMLAV
jgi:hypothetical protein